MGKLSYFMKQKDRTDNNYTTYKKQHRWNFTKYLIDKNGEVAGRFGSRIEPGDPSLKEAIESVL